MESKCIRRSAITGRKYDLFDNDTVAILNQSQAAFYVANNVSILDVELSEDRKTGKPILVYLFKRSETKEAYDQWCKQKEGK